MLENWPVNPVDIVVLVVLVISAALAFFRGFVHEALGVGAWIGAILAALYGLPYARPYAREYIPIEWAADLVVAVGIFLVVLFALSVITALIARRVQESALNTLDRSLGFLFGLARGALVVVVLYMAGSWLVPPDQHPAWVQQAKSMPIIEEGAVILDDLIPLDLMGTGSGEATPADALQQSLQPAPQQQGGGSGGYSQQEQQAIDGLIESTQQ
jgi:membrane protein required for colicin V production